MFRDRGWGPLLDALRLPQSRRSTKLICTNRRLTAVIHQQRISHMPISPGYHDVAMKFDGLLPSFLRNMVEKAPGLS